MKFYSGFSLKDDDLFFKNYIKDSLYSVCGFSYGAIKAFIYVKEELQAGKRVDTLQLFSPAFFQTKPSRFKRLQTLSYTKNKDVYLAQFMEGCFSPHEVKEVERSHSTVEELDELLNFEWVASELQVIADEGVTIEVYLGSEDRIIDVKKAREFFLDVSTVTYVKNANHFLQTN